MTDGVVIGIDVGGTKILSVLATPEGEISQLDRRSMVIGDGVEAAIEAIVASARHVVQAAGMTMSDVRGVGIAMAGLVDAASGVLVTSPNLPGWQNVPLRREIEERLGLPCAVGNDANAAALGEYAFGAGKGLQNFIYLILGTGIGGGIIIDGKLFTGISGTAGEIGHMTIDANGPRCRCGNIGCWEALASGGAVGDLARKALAQRDDSLIREIAGGDLASVTAETVFSAARQGDSLALDIVSQVAAYIGVGLANLVNLFNPEAIIFGGGVSRDLNMILDIAQGILEERAFRRPREAVRLMPSQLGDNSGALGAVALALDLGAQGRLMSEAREYLDLLRKSDLLGALEDSQLLELARHVQVRRFAPEEALIREGEPGDGAYLVSSGAVAVTKVGERGAGSVALGILGPGQVVGEMALLDQGRRSATATAIAETTCIFLSTTVFSRMLERNPSIASALLPILSQRLRDADRWIQSLM